MARYANGQIPRSELVLLGSGWNEDGYWEHLATPGTAAKIRALVRLGEVERGRTLTITPGWNVYRPLEPQRQARAAACARGRCGDAAYPGTSSHGGEYEGRDSLAVDFYNWLWVWGSQAAFYAACRQVGLEPGFFDWEPWHVIDWDLWAPVLAGGDGTEVTEEEIMGGPIYIHAPNHGRAVLDVAAGVFVPRTDEEAAVASELFDGRDVSARVFDVAANLTRGLHDQYVARLSEVVAGIPKA